MARSRWRLLAAACSLIFVASIFAAPIILCGQGSAADRSSSFAPVAGPKTSPSGYVVPVAPIGIPRSPDPPIRYPGVPGNSAFQKLVFRQLVRSAGMIFSGRVIFVGHAQSSFRPSPASTSVTFRVEHVIRGTSPGQNLTIHEWAGLWNSGERYRVGEHVLLFLYAPSRLGLTSPVAGALGRFKMDSQGQVVMSGQHIATFAGIPGLDGKAVVSYADFAIAVRRSEREE